MKKRISFINLLPENKNITLIAEFIIGVIVVIGSLSIFFSLAEDILEKEAFSFDTTIMQGIYAFRNPDITAVMNFISFFGGEYFLTAAILFTIYIIYRKHRKDAFIFAFIFCFGVILNIVLKNSFQRPRPDIQPLIHETSYSFPSGHAMNSFVFYTCLSFFIFRRMSNKRIGYFLIILSVILILFIGLSRIYLGVHYPSDVIAGYVAGLFWFVLVLLVEKTVRYLHVFRKNSSQEEYHIPIEEKTQRDKK